MIASRGIIRIYTVTVFTNLHGRCANRTENPPLGSVGPLWDMKGAAGRIKTISVSNSMAMPSVLAFGPWGNPIPRGILTFGGPKATAEQGRSSLAVCGLLPNNANTPARATPPARPALLPSGRVGGGGRTGALTPRAPGPLVWNHFGFSREDLGSHRFLCEAVSGLYRSDWRAVQGIGHSLLYYL